MKRPLFIHASTIRDLSTRWSKGTVRAVKQTHICHNILFRVVGCTLYVTQSQDATGHSSHVWYSRNHGRDLITLINCRRVRNRSACRARRYIRSPDDQDFTAGWLRREGTERKPMFKLTVESRCWNWRVATSIMRHGDYAGRIRLITDNPLKRNEGKLTVMTERYSLSRRRTSGGQSIIL